jgi:hypothetical protein
MLRITRQASHTNSHTQTHTHTHTLFSLILSSSRTHKRTNTHLTHALSLSLSDRKRKALHICSCPLANQCTNPSPIHLFVPQSSCPEKNASINRKKDKTSPLKTELKQEGSFSFYETYFEIQNSR